MHLFIKCCLERLFQLELGPDWLESLIAVAPQSQFCPRPGVPTCRAPNQDTCRGPLTDTGTEASTLAWKWAWHQLWLCTGVVWAVERAPASEPLSSHTLRLSKGWIRLRCQQLLVAVVLAGE